MSRSKWKGSYTEIFKNKDIKQIWSRSSVIPDFLVGKTVLIHTGKTFKKVFISREKVGYKFGSFANTRKFTNKFKLLKKKK